MGDPIVRLQSGDIRGILENTRMVLIITPSREFHMQNHQLDPIPKKPWTAVIDCKSYGPICLQYDFFFKVTSTNEDCLHLNVFTRSIDGTNIPVMVVIHAGAFIFGSSNNFIYGPDYMIRKNIVLVTINYRLGVLGFLNLQDEVAPGNQAIKDQLLALQWIQQNIRYFGGNPDNVTVLGLTAGAICAQYLALSPLSKGLVHKGISQGSSLYNPIAEIKNPKLMAVKLCSFLGRELTDAAQILEFLRTVDADKLLQAQESLRLSIDYLPFGPGIDDKSPNPVMPIDPITAANQGTHLPYIVGFNSDQTIITLIGLSREEFFLKCDANFDELFRFNTKNILQRYGLTATQVRKWYYKNERVCNENVDKYVDMSSHFYFIEGIHRFCRVQAEQSSAPTYLYRFSYNSSDSISQRMIKNAPKGVSHFDELPYFFKMGAFEALGIKCVKKGTSQYRIMKQVTEMWTNFAKYGRTTVNTTDLIPVHWTPVRDGTVLCYLNIDEDITMQSTINFEQKLLALKDIRV